MLYQLAPTSLFDAFEEMDRLLTGSFPRSWFGRHTQFPAMNVWSDEKEVVVTAELPGVNSQDLEITAQGDTLTLRGKREPEVPAGETIVLRRERVGSSFTRSLNLPFPVDRDSAKATYDNGLLTIRLQRPAEQQPRRIAISKV